MGGVAAMKNVLSKIAIAVLMILPVTVVAQDTRTPQPNLEPTQAETSTPVYAPTKLGPILDRLSKSSGRQFLVSAHVDAEVVSGTTPDSRISYSELLTILRNNGLAAVDDGNTVSIVPEFSVRQFPSLTIYADDDSIDDGAFVTRVVELKNSKASSYVPIFRPLIPMYGFMASHPDTNSLIIFDRYRNVKRLAGIIEKMDASARSSKH
jgi:general secretion pathway protein D